METGMKIWFWLVLCTVVCWGAYVPILHEGQSALGKNSALRTFLFVGIAYFLVSGGVMVYMLLSNTEPMTFNTIGITYAMIAGVLGAVGALAIVFALKYGGRPLTVVPLVFAGAPIVGTFVGMMMHKPATPPRAMFYAGILLAAGGAALVLKYKPS